MSFLRPMAHGFEGPVHGDSISVLAHRGGGDAAIDRERSSREPPPGGVAPRHETDRWARGCLERVSAGGRPGMKRVPVTYRMLI